VSQPTLWPPLELVEAALAGRQIDEVLLCDIEAISQAAHSQTKNAFLASNQFTPLLLPIAELARRRAAVVHKAFTPDWAPGRLLQIEHDGLVLGILLNQQIRVQERCWTGWLAASETSWASAFDVLLEPEDDPFEPLFGVIQTWNPITIESNHTIRAQVVGEVSAARLASIRLVAEEHDAGVAILIPSEPGRIALRRMSDAVMVLCGTPVGRNDVRGEYQRIYRQVAARLMALQLTDRVSHASQTAYSLKQDKTSSSE
jgi:hypothetical protein